MRKRIRIITLLAVISAAVTISSCTAAQNTKATQSIPVTSGDQALTTGGSAAGASATDTDGSTVLKAEYVKITPAEAKALMDAGNVTVLDVRTKEEYDAGHIKDAVRLEMADFAQKASSVLPDKNAVILVYCRSGNRSKTASGMLIQAGYTNIKDFGGIIDWPYEIVK